MTTIHEFGPYRLDAEAEMLFRESEPVALGRRAVMLLRLLVERAGTPVSKDALMQAAWLGLAIEESNLTVQIAALRRIFADVDGGATWIETLPRRGYRYIGPAVSTGPEAALPTSPASVSDKPSLAVLPLSNLSEDPAQDYFSDGITGDIIAELSRFRSLFLVARHSGFAYRGKSAEIKRVGRELGVRYVAEGSVRKLGSRVRVTVQLLDAGSGYNLWTERYDRELENIFSLQDEIVRAIVAALPGRLEDAGREIARRKRTSSITAYDLVLLGNERRRQLTVKGMAFRYDSSRWSGLGEAAGGPSSRGITSLSTDTASRLALASNIRACRGELVSSDGITDCGAASLNSAATISLADRLVSAFASPVGAGNAALRFASTVVTFGGMALNASATLAFGVATLGRDTAI